MKFNFLPHSIFYYLLCNMKQSLCRYRYLISPLSSGLVESWNNFMEKNKSILSESFSFRHCHKKTKPLKWKLGNFCRNCLLRVSRSISLLTKQPAGENTLSWNRMKRGKIYPKKVYIRRLHVQSEIWTELNWKRRQPKSFERWSKWSGG